MPRKRKHVPKRHPFYVFLPWLFLALAAPVCEAVTDGIPGKLDFNSQVLPILADRCFTCHGPDERARKANLRLDIREHAIAMLDLESGTRAIAPGDPESSELYHRIMAESPDDLMPPPGSNLTLTPAEKEVLRTWIKEGAEYQMHWAFVPISEIPIPGVSADALVRNPIDAFVSASFEKNGLRPAKEATRETLVRRLSLDLTGLPPKLEEIDQFLGDHSADAYDKLVLRLLASTAYGEHQARRWMDLARFADTYGYQSDVERDLSPWRDWVIRAFNENLSYDQFITWQIAGDLLPGATREQILATALNRLHRQTNEGGSIDEEFRTEYVADRVETAGTAFLGLTLACARCHDHKYDPITQKDFYQMAAFFNNIDESGLYSHFTAATPTPTLLLYAPGEEQRHQLLKQNIQRAEASYRAKVASARARFDRAIPGGNTMRPRQPVAAFPFDELASDKTYDRTTTNRFVTLIDAPQLTPGYDRNALLFNGDNSAVLKGSGRFDRTTVFSFSLWLKPAEVHDRAVIFHRSRAWSDSGSRGYELLLEQNRPSFALIHFWPGNAIKVQATNQLPVHTWSHLVVTYDGSSRAAGIGLFLNGEPLTVKTVRDNLYKDIVHREEWGDTDVANIELTLAGRFRDSGFKNGAIDELQVFDCELTSWEIKQLFDSRHTPNGDELFDLYVQELDEECRKAAAELARLRRDESHLVNDIPEIMVMHELAYRRPTFVLKRGAYDAPGEMVEPGTPKFLTPFSADLPPNRLGLARWMVDPRNPLTARVAVNRIWESHFGRGLVETPEDFGVQGRLPTHPHLLDWLARHFVHSGWDVKALHRLIVTSATYRQTSEVSSDVRARDPDNRGLARGPKHRLDAEQIRDQALSISGLLSPRLGGASVKPYQPPGLWEEAGTGKQYKQDQGEGLYRRSLYTFWRRTAPPPSMLIFDAPSREVCVARRERTSTPLQALVLMNDPQFVEAARVLAERLLLEHPAELEQVFLKAFRLATGRRPDHPEMQILRRLFEEQLQEFQGNPGGAEALLATGQSAKDASLDPVRVAAVTLVINSLMNLDEFVTKR